MFKKRILPFIACAILFCAPLITQAATLTLSTESKKLYLYDEFEVTLSIDAEKAINAVSIEISYPVDVLSATKINTGDSVIGLWAHEPSINQTTGSIRLEGGLPTPGFLGTNGKIATILFKVRAIAHFSLQIKEDTKILRNDGLGTPDNIQIINLSTESYRPLAGQVPNQIIAPADTISPTNLVLNIGKDNSLFDGKYFAAFQAQDNAQIDHYELAELLTSENKKYPESTDWYKATSPQILKHQQGKLYIFLKAVDTSSNETITNTTTQLSPEHTLNKHDTLFLTASFIVLLVISLLVFLQRHKNKIKDSVQK